MDAKQNEVDSWGGRDKCQWRRNLGHDQADGRNMREGKGDHKRARRKEKKEGKSGQKKGSQTSRAKICSLEKG
jgi:hypothetical protein